MSKTTAEKKTERPPIVAILGHVDHGKSTLLDYIRSANTVDSEAGGITQHVAAYEVVHKDEKRITFVDTPGHEAFGAIRSRSAGLADIAILIVSAEEGVKQQTKEALATIVESKTPYVVAVNKIDSPKANAEKTLGELAESGVYLEGRGGDIPFAQVSAKTGDGVDELLELILLVAEVEEYTGDPSRSAEGVIVEAHRDPKRGVSATLIITDGTLSKGMHVASSGTTTPVRILESTTGHTLEDASFSSPITLTGWSELPAAGTPFASFSSKKEAEEFATELAEDVAVREALPEEVPEDTAVVPLIIKADVAGSVDAIVHEINKLRDAHERLIIRILLADVGALSENDIKAAGSNSNTILIGFSTKLDPGVRDQAERRELTLETFSIIYKLSEWLDLELAKRIPKIQVSEVTGRVEILKTFSETKHKQVVGGRVTEGSISKGDAVSIERRGETIGEGSVVGVQVLKESVDTVREGNECGIEVKTKMSIAARDELVVSRMVTK